MLDGVGAKGLGNFVELLKLGAESWGGGRDKAGKCWQFEEDAGDVAQGLELAVEI